MQIYTYLCIYIYVCVCVYITQLVLRNTWECLLKFLVYRPFELEMLLLGFYIIHTHFQISSSRGMFIAALFFIMKNLKPSKCSLMGVWLNKL